MKIECDLIQLNAFGFLCNYVYVINYYNSTHVESFVNQGEHYRRYSRVRTIAVLDRASTSAFPISNSGLLCTVLFLVIAKTTWKSRATHPNIHDRYKSQRQSRSWNRSFIVSANRGHCAQKLLFLFPQERKRVRRGRDWYERTARGYNR